MSYLRAQEDKKRGKKNPNQLAKTRVAEERTLQAPRRKEWVLVSKRMSEWAKKHGIKTKRKGGQWFVPNSDYVHVYVWYDHDDIVADRD